MNAGGVGDACNNSHVMCIVRAQERAGQRKSEQPASLCENEDESRLHCRCFVEKDFMGTGLSRRDLMQWPERTPFLCINDLKQSHAPVVISHYSKVFGITSESLQRMNSTAGSLNIEFITEARFPGGECPSKFRVWMR